MFNRAVDGVWFLLVRFSDLEPWPYFFSFMMGVLNRYMYIHLLEGWEVG